MSASKAPAYFGLVVAVAAGVLISGNNRHSPSNVAPPLDMASAPAASEPQAVEPKLAPAMSWRQQTLSMGPLRLKANLPWFGENAICALPNPGDDEVGVCQRTTGGSDTSIWQIRVVTQRNRFVPVTWFDQAIQSLRALPVDVVTRQLGNEANAVANAGFTDASLLPPAELSGAIAIRGSAAAPAALSAGQPQSCVYAFLLAANRPTTVLYCADSDTESLTGAQNIVTSLLKLNASSEYKRGSLQAAEHSLYLKRLRAAGGPAGAPELVSSEQAYEQSAAAECAKYPLISQEHYDCSEAFAMNRLPAP
ncbi:hypothetical protein VL15_08730 [Burkholderia cepacia]|uniref:Uncharacterized protein n=1 Tax=Burkholderia cepacia TaxID=292 RepID=A0A0J5X7G5_BURCE|nr:hypothetical protein [Burkholderia cepacia]KML60466.1 hypothetical protein VL15_08730 [Burkholderia cepacia]